MAQGDALGQGSGGVQLPSEGLRHAPGLLRLPGRALGPPPDDQPHREHLRNDLIHVSAHEGQRLTPPDSEPQNTTLDNSSGFPSRRLQCFCGSRILSASPERSGP